jgi:hypothetical protein
MPFELWHLEPGAYVIRSEALRVTLRFQIWAGQSTALGTIPLLPISEWRWKYREPRD